MLIETYLKHISKILEFYQIPSEEYLSHCKSTSNILGIYNYLKNIVNINLLTVNKNIKIYIFKSRKHNIYHCFLCSRILKLTTQTLGP